MSRKSIKLSLEVSPELNDALQKMAIEMHSTKSEVLRRSVALINMAIEEKQQGNHLGVFDSDKKILKEIVGF